MCVCVCVCVCVRSERGGLLRRTGASLSPPLLLRSAPPELPHPTSLSLSLCQPTHLHRISGVLRTARTPVWTFSSCDGTFLLLEELRRRRKPHRCKPEVPTSHRNRSELCVRVCVCVCVCSSCRPGVCFQRRSGHVCGGEEAVLCGLSLRGR